MDGYYIHGEKNIFKLENRLNLWLNSHMFYEKSAIVPFQYFIFFKVKCISFEILSYRLRKLLKEQLLEFVDLVVVEIVLFL